jgi:hypothetical protein
MRQLLYLFTKKISAFLDRPSLSVHGAGSASMGPVSVTVDVSAASPAGFDGRPLPDAWDQARNGCMT